MKISSFNKMSIVMMGMTLLFSCSRDGGIQQKNSDDDKVNPIKPPITLYTPAEINISAGYQHTLVLSESGSLSGWGRNKYGELGNNIGDAVVYMDTDLWGSISAGYDFTVGVKKDGSLWAMGYNNAGQLGTGDNDNKTTFTRIGNENDWVKVSAGYLHTLAIKKDGSLWAWGYNEFSQLGDNTDKPTNQPKRIGNENDWKDIAAGNQQSFAIKKDGSLWAWGYNFYGQLGLQHNNKVSSPTKVDNSEWKMIVAGITTTGGIKQDGTLWMWGDDFYGQLGIGTGSGKNGTNSFVPVKIKDGIWKKVSIGRRHVVAIKDDNTLWSWGQNLWGELGIGGKTGGYKNIPQKIGNDNNWKDVSSGYNFSIAQKEDLTYWGWGMNREKQISKSTDKDEITEPMKIK